MIHTIDDFARRIKFFLDARFSQVHPSPIIVCGNQKAGTTVIASLLGKATNLSVEIDPFFRIKDQINLRKAILEKELLFKDLVCMNKYYFSFDIIKDPNFIFFLEEVRACFPLSKFVFIVRDPRDNIRSILNRLKLPGNLTSLGDDHLDSIPEAWRMIIEGMIPSIEGKNYVEKLANRWRLATDSYLQSVDQMILIRYEDFVLDKVFQINKLATTLGLEMTNDIVDYVDVQYQPRGQKNVNFADFYGSDNLEKIELACVSQMKKFGYEPNFNKELKQS